MVQHTVIDKTIAVSQLSPLICLGSHRGAENKHVGILPFLDTYQLLAVVVDLDDFFDRI